MRIGKIVVVEYTDRHDYGEFVIFHFNQIFGLQFDFQFEGFFSFFNFIYIYIPAVGLVHTVVP